MLCRLTLVGLMCAVLRMNVVDEVLLVIVLMRLIF